MPVAPTHSPQGEQTMLVQALGHVVLKVRDLQRSEAFYSGALGIPIISRVPDPTLGVTACGVRKLDRGLWAGLSESRRRVASHSSWLRWGCVVLWSFAYLVLRRGLGGV